jgi:predicted nucleic acid-binding protein
LAVGKSFGIEVPEVDRLEWITIRRPVSAATLPLVTDLGPGESQVLALALETRGLW